MENDPSLRSVRFDIYKPKNVRSLFKAPRTAMMIGVKLVIFSLFITWNIPVKSLLIIMLSTGILVFTIDGYFKNHKAALFKSVNPYCQNRPKDKFFVLTFWNSFIYLSIILMFVKFIPLFLISRSQTSEGLTIAAMAGLGIYVIVTHVRWFRLWKTMEVRMAGMGLRRTKDLPMNGFPSND